jgi:phage anti-repressor protein
MEKFIKQFSNVPNEFVTDFFNISKEDYNDNDFSIDFEKVVKWLGVLKGNLKTLLVNNFEEKYDYTIKTIIVKGKNNNTHKDLIMLTPDTFKELCMLSRTEKAKSVRKYFLETEKLIRKYHEVIKEKLYKQVGLLENNQKPKINIKGGVIYIFEALNTDLTLYKIGKSKFAKGRFSTYNSGNANDIKILFIIRVSDIDSVESCVKNAMKKFQYRKYKEIYQVDIDVIKELVTRCDVFVDQLKKFTETKSGVKNIKRMKNTDNKLFMAIYDKDDELPSNNSE